MSPLHVGSLVAFKSESVPYQLGYRRGTVVSLDTPYAEYVANARQLMAAALGRPPFISEEVESHASDPVLGALCVPIVRIVSAEMPGGFDLPIATEFFEVIADSPAALN